MIISRHINRPVTTGRKPTPNSYIIHEQLKSGTSTENTDVNVTEVQVQVDANANYN